MVGYGFAGPQLFWCSVRSLGWLVVLLIGLRVRKRIARLPDKDLSRFLVDSVFTQGIVIGLGQLVFLLFSSLQCDVSNTDFHWREEWKECRRTLYSQTGLGCLSALYYVLKVVSGVVPLRILDRHILKSADIVAMNLNSRQMIEFFGFCTCAGCGLFLISLYGADGDFGSEFEGETDGGGTATNITAVHF